MKLEDMVDHVELVDVLVVGAGPVGLMLSGELALAGAHTVIVEALTEPSDEERARGVGVLGAEALRRRGLGTQLWMQHQDGRRDDLLYQGNTQSHFGFMHKFDHAVVGEPGRQPAVIWQPRLEAILAEYAVGHGCDMRRGHRLLDLHHDGDMVVATVGTDVGDYRIHCAYLVGCDGGHSTVRALAGFDFPGIEPSTMNLIAEVEVADPDAFPPTQQSPRGSLVARRARNGRIMVRLSEPISTDKRAGGTPVTAGEFSESLARVTGVEVPITRLRGARRGLDNSRQVSTYRRGRIFLAGDAAHIHSPMGGQGLNLGLTDAVNLGWKLAAALRGLGDSEELLDTYHRERHPAGAAVLHNTRAQHALLVPTPQVDALHDIFSELLDLPEVKTYFNTMMTGVNVTYPMPYPSGDHPQIGRHIGDFVVDDTTVYSLLTDGRPLLLFHQQIDAGLDRFAAPWADRVTIQSALLIARSDLRAMLVRPDGVVAWATTMFGPADTDTLQLALHTWFGPARAGQTGASPVTATVLHHQEQLFAAPTAMGASRDDRLRDSRPFD